MKKIVYFYLILIILFGIFLRTYSLEKSPPSVNWDEASIGYNAYSILKTGRDEYGQFLPLFIRSFDDYKSAIPVYLIIPFISVLGLNDISIRLISVIAGLVNVLLVFLISRKIFKSDTVGLLSALFMSTAPFAVHFSRILFEANIALSFFLVGFWAYLNRKRKFFKEITILFFILALYTYHSYKALIPLFGIMLWYSNRKEIKSNSGTFKLVFLGMCLLLPLAIETLSGRSLARFSTTSVFTLWPPGLVNNLNQTHIVDLFTQFFLHGNIYYFLWELGGRFLAYFSPSNLFLLEAIEPNLRIPYLAIFYPFSFILWIVGLIFVLKDYKRFKELIFLLLLAPIPAVLTWNWFQSVRVLPLFAAFTILMGIGAVITIDWLVKLFKPTQIKLKKALYAGLVALCIWGSFYLLDGLIVIIPSRYFGDWQPGFKESIPIVSSLEDQYNQIIIESPQAQPYIFTLFYSSYDPDKYLKEVDYQKISKKPRDFYDFGKYKFRKIYWPDDRSSKKTLFMGTIYSLPERDIKNTPNAKIVKDVLDKSGNVAVRIVIID